MAEATRPDHPASENKPGSPRRRARPRNPGRADARTETIPQDLAGRDPARTTSTPANPDQRNPNRTSNFSKQLGIRRAAGTDRLAGVTMRLRMLGESPASQPENLRCV